ncbi:serine protease snk [Haematobia irritans]|uniref:serine protease snk n=1 Tax=Haematobia irritans TaxID=7368 RepID=UPI003F50A9E8
MTAIGFVAGNGEVDYKCGGSLISDQFVITAAHCTNIAGEIPTKVRIGDLNLMEEEHYLEPQIRTIKKIHNHPAYRSTSYYNDIALLELDSEVDLTEFVRPIRLWTRPSTQPFTIAYAMGYGSTDFAKQRTNRLTDLNMTIISNDDCNRELPTIPETERGIIDSQLCARDYKLNRDTCQGDSGGPLQLNIRGRRRRSRLHYHLIGLTSYGLYCRSGYPSIFTRVYSFLDWIESIVWKDEFDEF